MLYSYSADSIKAFDIRTRSLTFRTVKGDSLPVRHGMNLMDGKTGRIIPYEVYNDALLAELDPASGEWRRLGETSPDAVWHHHASAYRSKDHTLLLFGGYGNRRYSDRLVRSMRSLIQSTGRIPHCSCTVSTWLTELPRPWATPYR